MRVIISTLILTLLIIFSCSKDDDLMGAGDTGSLSFSVDTLLFDTVFTTVGSATRYLKVYNNVLKPTLKNVSAKDYTQALILAPTHELANQIKSVITSLGNFLKIKINNFFYIFFIKF